jgi:putative ABC transport system ATP-binding protein
MNVYEASFQQAIESVARLLPSEVPETLVARQVTQSAAEPDLLVRAQSVLSAIGLKGDFVLAALEDVSGEVPVLALDAQGELLLISTHARGSTLTPQEAVERLGTGMHRVLVCRPAFEHRPVFEATTPVGRALALLSREKSTVGLVLVYAAAIGLLTLATPIAVQTLVNTVSFGSLVQPLVVLSIMLLIALSFKSVLTLLQSVVVEQLQRRMLVRTAVDLSARVHGSPQHLPPRTLLHYFFEAPTIQKSLASLLTDGISTILQVGIGSLLLAFYHPALLAFDLVILTVLGLVLVLPHRQGMQTSIDESKAKHGIASRLLQRWAQGSSTEEEELSQEISTYLRYRAQHFRLAFWQNAALNALLVLMQVGLLALGGFLVLSSTLTLGQLVAAELIVASIASALKQTAKLLDGWYDLIASADKIAHIGGDSHHPDGVAQKGGILHPIDTLRGEGAIAIELRHDGETQLHVPAGTSAALVAMPGTWGLILSGELKPQQGIVFLGEQDAVKLASRPRIERIDGPLVAQGTLQEVLRGASLASDKTIYDTLATFGLEPFLLSLPDRLSTRIESLQLSAVQGLALSLTRALLSHPRLLMIDVAFDAIPAPILERWLAALKPSKTTFTLVLLTGTPQSVIAQATQQVLLPPPEVI